MSDTKLAVRRAASEDWLALKTIRLEALLDTPEAYGSTYRDTTHFSNDRWRAMVGQLCYFLAEHDGIVVGMASGGLNNDHPDTHWLYGMYVTPSARGGATASLLVDAVVEWARGEGASELYLDVAPSVDRARAFYVKMGFRPTGGGRVMYRDPGVVLSTMSKSIVDA